MRRYAMIQRICLYCIVFGKKSFGSRMRGATAKITHEEGSCAKNLCKNSGAIVGGVCILQYIHVDGCS
jgi:hypothetical protein